MPNEGKPEIKIRGRKAKNTEKKQKLSNSNWFITISTNQRYAENDPHKDSDQEILEDLVQEILENIPKYVKIKQEGHTWSKEYIGDVDASYTVEFGKKTKALHTHIFLKIQNHRTKLHLDYDAIKKKVSDRLGLDKFHFDVRLVAKTTDQNIEAYLQKYD